MARRDECETLGRRAAIRPSQSRSSGWAVAVETEIKLCAVPPVGFSPWRFRTSNGRDGSFCRISQSPQRSLGPVMRSFRLGEKSYQPQPKGSKQVNSQDAGCFNGREQVQGSFDGSTSRVDKRTELETVPLKFQESAARLPFHQGGRQQPTDRRETSASCHRYRCRLFAAHWWPFCNRLRVSCPPIQRAEPPVLGQPCRLAACDLLHRCVMMTSCRPRGLQV